MLKRLPSERGVSLIELVIALSIGAFLIVMAAPNYRDWIQNTQLRATAEGILDGLQLARAEAVRRNTTVRFQLTDNLSNGCALSTTGTYWVASLDDPAGACDKAASDTVAPRIIQVGAPASTNPVVASGQSAFIFNGWGRLTSAAADIDVSNTTGGTCVALGGTMRCLRIVVSATGQIRMCDPSIKATTDPLAC
jgi:type IV fimbrial biogenesis protein FimT